MAGRAATSATRIGAAGRWFGGGGGGGGSDSREKVRKDIPTESKQELLDLVSRAPRNSPTPKRLTEQILEAASKLESSCPTPDDDVLPMLKGTWELLWTAQDRSRPESRFAFINPLENQSYSNNPFGESGIDVGGSSGGGGGRANPVLPRPIQDRLEDAGIISTEEGGGPQVKSTQSVDVKAGLVRNVVSFGLGSGKGDGKGGKKPAASLTVTVKFKPDSSDARRVNVKFDACRVVLPGTPIDVNFPLGIIGPTGWLRTGYVDDDLRITRGHKGSVFVLRRPGATASSSATA